MAHVRQSRPDYSIQEEKKGRRETPESVDGIELGNRGRANMARIRQSGPDYGRGAARAEDAQGTPNQSHLSPSILVYED